MHFYSMGMSIIYAIGLLFIKYNGLNINSGIITAASGVFVKDADKQEITAQLQYLAIVATR
jgi:hypothetical protein